MFTSSRGRFDRPVALPASPRTSAGPFALKVRSAPSASTIRPSRLLVRSLSKCVRRHRRRRYGRVYAGTVQGRSQYGPGTIKVRSRSGSSRLQGPEQLTARMLLLCAMCVYIHELVCSANRFIVSTLVASLPCGVLRPALAERGCKHIAPSAPAGTDACSDL